MTATKATPKKTTRAKKTTKAAPKKAAAPRAAPKKAAPKKAAVASTAAGATKAAAGAAPAARASQKKSAWPRGERRRLSAILRPQPGDPADFYLDPQAAWEALGESGAPPKRLDAKTEFVRALVHRFVSWQDRAGRCFSDEPWNALVALWVGIEGPLFALELLLGNRTEDPNQDLFSADAGAPWYAMRRYLYRATEGELEAAIDRVRPIFERLSALREPSRSESCQLSWLAFAFSQGTGWADQLLRRWVEGGEAPGEMMPVLAASTDAALALKAAKKYGGLGPLYTVFDLVESHGKAALPILALGAPSRAPDKKRLAAAQAIAAAL